MEESSAFIHDLDQAILLNCVDYREFQDLLLSEVPRAQNLLSRNTNAMASKISPFQLCIYML